MVAGLLLFFVLVNCVLTAFMIGRWRGVREEIKLMDESLASLGALLADAGNSDTVPVSPSPVAGVDAGMVADAKTVLASASPEELAQARALLESLGL